MARLIKTTCQVLPETIEQLKQLYPQWTQSEIVRYAVEYLLERRPVIQTRVGYEFVEQRSPGDFDSRREAAMLKAKAKQDAK